MERSTTQIRNKKMLAISVYVGYWIVVAYQSHQSLLAITLIAIVIGYVLLNIVFEHIEKGV